MPSFPTTPTGGSRPTPVCGETWCRPFRSRDQIGCRVAGPVVSVDSFPLAEIDVPIVTGLVSKHVASNVQWRGTGLYEVW